MSHTTTTKIVIMTTVGKKEFERLYQGGSVEQISKDNYAFINNEENVYILFDLSNDKVKENSHTNLSEAQLNKILDEVYDFRREEIEQGFWEDDVMDDYEIHANFY